MAAILGWIGWLIAIILAAVSEGTFGVLLLRWVLREGRKVEKGRKCRGCARRVEGGNGSETRFCSGCGLEDPMREERSQDLEQGEHLVKE